MSKTIYHALMAVLVGLALVGLAPQEARAGLLPQLVGSPTADGSNYRFTYNVDIPASNLMKTGDSFTIYDFAGYVSGSVIPPSADWKVSVTNTTLLPGFTVQDNPTLPNLTFIYQPNPSSTTLTGSFTFSALSQFGTVFNPPDDSLQFNAASTVHLAGHSGVEEALTTVAVPTAQSPEPATLTLLALGLPLLTVLYVRRRRPTLAV